MTKTYHKEPMIVQAIKLEESEQSITEVLNFVWGTNYPYFGSDSINSLIAAIKKRGGMELNGQNSTAEGLVLAEFGDYIVKEANSTFYVCKADLFEKYYHEFKEEK